MNDGKTTTSLALYSALSHTAQKKLASLSQWGNAFRYRWRKIDEDCLLLSKTFDVSIPIQAMSPLSRIKTSQKNTWTNLKRFILN